MTRLVLVRHGETDWNRLGRFQGQADPPLNAVGLQQAAALGHALVGTGLVAVYSSDLQRAFHTAQAAADAAGLPVRSDPRLREVKQGVWEGMLAAEIAVGYPAEWAAREMDPLNARSPGGESVAEVASRMATAADDIARAHPEGRVLVVSHGLALAALKCLAIGLPLDQVRAHIPPNAEALEVDWPQAGERHARLGGRVSVEEPLRERS